MSVYGGNRIELHVPAPGRAGARTEDRLCDESGRCRLRGWVLQVGTEGRKRGAAAQRGPSHQYSRDQTAGLPLRRRQVDVGL
jgi:hypothetical protein